MLDYGEFDTYTIDNISKKIKILFSFFDEKVNKNYVVYTDGTKNSEGNINSYCAIYDPNDLTKKLKKIETKEEWNKLNIILNSIQNNK